MLRLSARNRVKLKLFFRLLPGYTIFFSSLVAIGFIYDNILGIWSLFFSFVCLRYKYLDAVTWHSESTKRCIALSIGLFALSSIPLIVFNSHKSIIACVPIAVGMTWFLYVLGLKTDRGAGKNLICSTAV